ncbi:MAG: class I SAM-dependent methyltransferase [Acidobacteriota bacterium]|nr:class I SAM-dependent methyltransferase [Acidobacteriota bacterium]
MKPLGKLCDAADWFDPEFERIIRVELEEELRFHRKQWEFAQIYRALQVLGYLNATSRGLSMGSGEERLLYSVARRAGHLTVTDLYGASSTWDCAQTDHPGRSLEAAAPFAVEPSRFTARRMDMRMLEFEDASFDFCYSSCAIEHIGDYDDFLRHLKEVRRVLKDDGIYVLTTEFHYGEDVIPAPHNYYFSSGFLHELVRAAAFVTLDGVDGSLSPHVLNRPVPASLSDLCADPSDAVTDMLLKAAPHVQLLTGGLPFSSMSLVLRKPAPGIPGGVLPMAGLEGSRRFIEAGVRRWKAFVENAQLSLDPFAGLSGGRPTRGVPRLVAWDGVDTLFHTGYVWLGSAARTVTVDLDAWPVNGGNTEIELRVHRQPTLHPGDVTCSSSTSVAIGDGRHVDACLPLSAEEGCSYSVLGKVTKGACWTEHATVQIGAG